MKKILSLVLALALVLTAVSAFAESTSTDLGAKSPVTVPTPAPVVVPETNTTTTKTTTTNYVAPAAAPSFDVIGESEQTKEMKDAFAAALAAGDILSVFPDDVKAQIPEGFATINEIVTVLLSGAEDLPGVRVELGLETQYEVGEKVCVALGLGNDEWILKEGTIAESTKLPGTNAVVFSLDSATIAKIVNKPVTLVVISK